MNDDDLLTKQYFANIDFSEKPLICSVDEGNWSYHINVDGYAEDEIDGLEEPDNIFDSYDD